MVSAPLFQDFKRVVGKPAARLRIAFLLLVCLLVPGWGVIDKARAEIVVSDATGREVRLAKPATRIVTNDSLVLLSLALIDPEPIARIAGWAAPRRLDRGMYAAFRDRFPEISNIPVVGAVVPANVSVETILSVKPDLFVVSLWQPDWQRVAGQLEAAGVPVIFLDGPQSAGRGPTEATAFSVELLGKVLAKEEQAGAFADFIRSRYEMVAERLEGSTRRPEVLVDAMRERFAATRPDRTIASRNICSLPAGRASVPASYRAMTAS